MRYEHYVKLLKATVTEIRELIKTRHITLIPQESKVTSSTLVLPQVSSNKNPNDLKRFPCKQRALLLSTLSCFDAEKVSRSEKFEKNNSEPNLLSNQRGNTLKEQFEAHKKKQLQNLKEIKMTQWKFQVQLSRKISESMKKHTDKEQLIEEEKNMNAKEKEDIYQRKLEEIRDRKNRVEAAMETDIITKLERFDQKVQKSEELHSKSIKNQVDRTLKLRKIPENLLKHQEKMMRTGEFDVLQRMVDKHEIVKSARDRIMERIEKESQRKKEEFEKKRSEALIKIKQSQKDFYLKSKNTELKLLAADRLLSDRKSDFHHKLAIQQEENRLKGIESSLKVTRAKRRHVIPI